MEGCVGYGLGAMYYSEVEVKNGRAVQRNFDTYRALRIQEMPKIEVAHRREQGRADGRRRARPAAAGAGRRQRHGQARRAGACAACRSRAPGSSRT